MIALHIFLTGVASITLVFITMYKVVKMVHGNQSDNHCKCNWSDTTWLSIGTTTVLVLRQLYYRTSKHPAQFPV